ncbi:Chromatin assembly factor 1 subunit B [Halocaridina rubra]|uniref:Chromatin assembly factor 1 subunit B n=1 Tax=Halocaridina rubra TaxID=373956 RepID=A0AAN8WN92_HALRR
MCDNQEEGDEYHYILICPAFSSLRELYIKSGYKETKVVHCNSITEKGRRRTLLAREVLRVSTQEILNSIMKCTIPEISWHNRDPVLALDVQPNQPDGIYRLATAGTDAHVVIWQLRILENGGISVEALCDLTRHNRAVNAVRFSPDGQILASADDEAAIILWKKQDSGETDIFFEETEKENKENWVIHKLLRGHLEDVYDISWSKCSQFLISGSVDNSAILWDVSKGKHMSILKEHKGFVQGVSWDPLNLYVATLSSDRCCRVYDLRTKRLSYKLDKTSLPSTDAEQVTEKITKLFYDDTLKSFCRRLSFSPDGEILLAPSGILEDEDGKTTNVTYVFSRHCFSKPVLYLPTKDKYTLAVRFCPLLFELKPLLIEEKKEDAGNSEVNTEKSESGEDWKKFQNLFDLPYRMVFAVATQNAIFLYDTQQPVPFGKISNMHYTRLSDIAWSSDGRILVVSSTDGYCSLVSFSEGELGNPYKLENTPQKSSPSVPLEKVSNENSLTNSPELLSNSDKKMDEENAVSDKNEKRDAESSNNRSVTRDSTPKPIAVKRLSDSSKQGKRVSLVTLSGPSQRCSTSDVLIAKKMQEDVKATEIKEKEESEGPSKTNPVVSPSKTPTRMSNSPRRVALITLSSPKGKKTGLGCEAVERSTQEMERENFSPVKSERGESSLSDSPAKTPSASQKTPRRLPLVPVSSPKVEKSSVMEMEISDEVKRRFEGEVQSPTKSSKDVAPSKCTLGSKTPRHVPLITLSSPKGKKNLGDDTR